MTDLFIKAKHWHLFLLIIVLPMLLQFTIASVFVGQAINMEQPDPSRMFEAVKYYPLVAILLVGVVMGWLWSIVTASLKKIPQEIEMKTTLFKVFFFFPLFYIVIMSIAVPFGISSMINAEMQQPDMALIFSMMAGILPLHLFSIFCYFYTIYFAAKTLKTVELRRRVTFGDFAGDFALLWLSPIGIWIIQPKVNEILGDSE